MDMLSYDFNVTDIVFSCRVPPENVRTIHRNRPSHGVAFHTEGLKTYRFSDGTVLTTGVNDLIFLPEGFQFLIQGRGGILRGLRTGLLGSGVGGLRGGFGLIQFLGQLIHLSGQRPCLIPGGAVLFVGGVQFQFAENSQRQGHGQQHRQHDDPNLTFLLHG